MNPNHEMEALRKQLGEERAARHSAELALHTTRMELEDLQQKLKDLDTMDPIRSLNEQRQFFETILNEIPADIAVFDKDHHYLFVNPIGIKNPEIRHWIIGKRDEDYVAYRGKDPSLVEGRRKVFNGVVESKQQLEWEESMLTPQGERRYHLRKMYPVLDKEGKVQLVIGYGVDITSRKLAEAIIERSEKRYRDLFDYSQAMICTHDLEGKLLSVNPAICSSLGYASEELIGRYIQDLVPLEGVEKFNEVYLKAILSNQTESGVFVVRNKEGKDVYLLFQNYLKEDEGSQPYVIGFAQDITERIEAEKTLKLAKKMTEDIADAKEAFLAKMSHEIRTPMNGVIGVAALLSKTELNKEQQHYIELIKDSANSLVLIVNDILDLEKIILGKLQLDHTPFNLVERVEMCVQSFKYKAEEKGVYLFYKNLIPDECIVLGDSFRLTQVLNNLLSNALKFTDQGSVIIETHLKKSESGFCEIEFLVMDTGIGIDQDQINAIFEPFVQASHAITKMFGGTGLGLSICKELIEMMRGTMKVVSEPGKGSTFSFIIPLERTHTPNIVLENHVKLNFKSLGHKQVLLAEDVVLNQFVARKIMESWGFDVTIANNGREAVDLLYQQEFDLVLMDVQMPVMGGIEATKRIRQMKDSSRSSIPIIALTANALKGDSEKYIAAGMNDYLAKPFDEAKLFTVISKNLANFEGRTLNIEIHHPEKTDNMESGTKLYDLSLVETISGGDQEFVEKMVGIFVESMPQNIQDLDQFASDSQWDQLSKIAHKMKSSIESMGIVSVKDTIRLLEQYGKLQENLDQIPSLVAFVKEHLNNAIGDLKKDFGL